MRYTRETVPVSVMKDIMNIAKSVAWSFTRKSFPGFFTSVEVEDFAMEGAEKAWNAIASYDPSRSLRSWVGTIVVNHIHTECDKKKRLSVVWGEMSSTTSGGETISREESAACSDGEFNADAAVNSEQFYEKWDAGVSATLTPGEMPFYERLSDGKKPREAAAELNVNSNVVSIRYCEIRKKLLELGRETAGEFDIHLAKLAG